jgi:hypothetical protein
MHNHVHVLMHNQQHVNCNCQVALPAALQLVLRLRAALRAAVPVAAVAVAAVGDLAALSAPGRMPATGASAPLTCCKHSRRIVLAQRC